MEESSNTTKWQILYIYQWRYITNESSIVNVLSLKDVTNIPGVHVTMDTLKEKAMLLHLPEAKKMKFSKCDEGLYFYDTSSNNNENKYEVNECSKKCQRQVSLLTTIEENKIIFTRANGIAI